MGHEVEFFLLDSKGNVANTADAILERIRKESPKADVVKEIGHNMIELGSEPSVKVVSSMKSMLGNMSTTLKAASREKTLLLPMGTYPAAFDPQMRTQGLYAIKQKLFAERFPITGRCCGFHLHHALPEGSYHEHAKNLKAALTPKAKKSLVEAYNFAIAIDPVLTTLLSSSPFYQGKHLGKDSRVIVYRGGKALGYSEGLYSELFLEFGELPAYAPDAGSLIDGVMDRYSMWKKAVRNLAEEAATQANYNSVLDTTWNPVKINAHGTIELRGMDMNMPSTILGISVAVKYLLSEIYQHNLHVTSSDIGIAEYFKEEKGKLYVPPDSYVRKKLQYLAAYMGLDNHYVYNYCKAWLKTAKRVTPPKARKLLQPFEDMIEEKKTRSDHILELARGFGYRESVELSPEIGRKISLSQADEFLKDVKVTSKLVENYSV